MTKSGANAVAPVVVEATLSYVSLPKDGPLRRRMPRAEKRRTQDYIDKFDAHTLVFDCFYDPRAGAVTLICPRLLNLWPMVRRGLSISGKPVRARRQTRVRTDYLRIRASSKPDTVTLRLGAFVAEIAVNADLSAHFAGLNCMTAVSKDNDLEWIADWARYHVSAHGLEAVVLFDNGSTEYATTAIVETLSEITGLKAISVVAADFPYGPTGGGGWKWEISSRFFQTAMLNIARLRFFAEARSVLSVDIDELVVSKSGQSVFDAAVRSRLGLVAFKGIWAFAKGADKPQRQAEHIWSQAGATGANTKWCIDPAGLLGRASWQVHRLAEIVFPFTLDDDFHFWHCRMTTTNWKKHRLNQPKNLIENAELKALFETHLPNE